MSLHRAVQYHNMNGGSGVAASRHRRVAHVDDARPTFHPPIFQDLYHFPSTHFFRASSAQAPGAWTTDPSLRVNIAKYTAIE